jgi:hypothetical protein
MIKVPKRNIENFKRMLQCEGLFKQAELQKDLGNNGRADILLARANKLKQECVEEGLIISANNKL